MQPTIAFRGVRKSDGMEADLTKRVHKLHTYFRPILACHVVVGFSQRRHSAGNRYQVRIDLSVPDDHILVRHEASQCASARALGLEKLSRSDEIDPSHKQARIAIREAFDVAKRRLQDYARRHRLAVKNHRPRRLPAVEPVA